MVVWPLLPWFLLHLVILCPPAPLKGGKFVDIQNNTVFPKTIFIQFGVLHSKPAGRIIKGCGAMHLRFS